MEDNLLPFINTCKLFWYLFWGDLKKFFYNFICFIVNHDFYFITFWMHCMLFLTIFIITFIEKIKLIVIVNWIVYVSVFLRFVMISFKYCLILLRYFLTDSAFLSPLLLHSIYLLLQKLFTLTGLWLSSSSSFSKRFRISLSTLSLITLFSFFSLKKFLYHYLWCHLVLFLI